MKKFTKSLALLTLVCFSLSSCGVMFGGSKFNGTIIAKDHPNAKIYVNGSEVGRGTAVVSHPRNVPFSVELRQDGCESKTTTFNNTFRTGNFIATLVTWGLIGVIIDAATGAIMKPEHRLNPAVERLSDKDFTFTVDYSGCPNN